MLSIDVLMLLRPGQAPRPEVVQAAAQQIGVTVNVYYQIGTPIIADRNRWDTIARARNAAKLQGSSPLVVYVDDDVLLESHCLQSLARELLADSRLAAVAADYSHDQHLPGRRGHVAMGATMFRRDLLQSLKFRSTEHCCECWCACMDLRQAGYDIRYSVDAQARHLRASSAQAHTPNTPVPAPRVLAAFDRRDIQRFEHQFLRSLRNSGNREVVTAVAYGLYPSERSRLMRLPGVTWDFQPFNGVMPPIRRLADFARHLACEDPRTPVAYWDVADVVFQDSLAPLWQEVRSTPDRLAAVIEPKSYPHNKVIQPWCLSIHDVPYRRQAFELLKRRPFLNSGFAAGTASVMRQYFETAHAMRHGPQLSGTTDWGDQMCLNLYCHLQPSRWRAIDQRWNYCVHDREAGEVVVGSTGRIQSRRGQWISVAHGNARSLRQFAILANH